MKRKRTIDGRRLLFTSATDPTDSICFLDRRGAVVWPTREKPGIVMVAGLVEEKHDSGEWPLRIIFEQDRQSSSELFRAMAAKGAFYACSLWLGDFGRLANDANYRKFIALRKPGGAGVLDSSDFSGIEETKEELSERYKSGLLAIDKGTQCADELRRLQFVDGKLDDSAFPAAFALCMIVNSYLIYPARTKKMRPKPPKKTGEGYR